MHVIEPIDFNFRNNLESKDCLQVRSNVRLGSHRSIQKTIGTTSGTGTKKWLFCRGPPLFWLFMYN